MGESLVATPVFSPAQPYAGAADPGHTGW